jgi:predicted DCC family thiol-disulfide oxidoreductase YuxK
MKRFHVRKEDGRLVTGAAAFVEVWKRLPQWRWAARATAIPGMVALLEATYQLFLAARPHLARLFAILSLNARREEIPGDSQRVGIKRGRNGSGIDS